MNNIATFNIANKQIRVVHDEHNNPWFNANDACAALGLVNPRQTIKHYVDESNTTKFGIIDARGCNQKANYINEHGLYTIILGSRKSSSILTDLIIDQVKNSRQILQALNEFEIPEDLAGEGLCVYVIRNTGTGSVKIGVSRDPAERLKQLQTGSDAQLELVAVKRTANAFAEEAALHRKHGERRLCGEWFSSETFSSAGFPQEAILENVAQDA